MDRNKLRLISSDDFSDAVKENGVAPDDIMLRQSYTINEVKEVKEPGEELTLEFIVTNAKVDRDADTIAIDGWDYKNYKKNPVVLWAHDYGLPPVARSTKIYQDGKNMVSRAAFTPKDLSEFGFMIYQMYKQKFMNAVSVGFIPVEYTFAEDRKYGINYLKQEIIEYSAVPVPSNPSALVQARSAGIEMAPMVEWAEKILDGEGSLIVPKHTIEAIRKSITDEKVILIPKAKATDVVIEPIPNEKESDVMKFTLFKMLLNTIDKAPRALISTEMKTLANAEDEAAFYELDAEVTEKFIENIVENFNDGDYTIKYAAISYERAHKSISKAPLDEPWDLEKEVENDLDIAFMKGISAWVELGNENDKSAYALIHHKGNDNCILVWRGVSDAMLKLLNGDHKIPLSDVKEVYDHIAKHYNDFDKEAPEFRFVEAQAMKHLSDVYKFDADSGELVLISKSDSNGNEAGFDFELEDKSSDHEGDNKNVFEVDGIDSVEDLTALLKSVSKETLDKALGRLD